MSTDNNDASAGTAVPVVFPDCPNWGKGGSYVLDPATGQRTLAHQDDMPAVPSVTTVKEKKRG